MTPEEAAEALRFDEAKYAGEGADLSLLHSLRKAELAIEAGPPVSSATLTLLSHVTAGIIHHCS